MWRKVRRLGRLRKSEDGMAIIEFALILPIIIVILMLFIESGFFFFNYVSAANAVREGARCGTVGHTVTSIENRVVDASGFNKWIKTDDVLVKYLDDDGDGTEGELGETIQVAAQYQNPPLFSWFGIDIYPDTYWRSATMRLEVAKSDADRVGCNIGGVTV